MHGSINYHAVSGGLFAFGERRGGLNYGGAPFATHIPCFAKPGQDARAGDGCGEGVRWGGARG